jgi:hypothetical protein
MKKDIIFENGMGYKDGDDGETVLFGRGRVASEAQLKYIADIRRKNPYAPRFNGKTSAEASDYIKKYKDGMI